VVQKVQLLNATQYGYDVEINIIPNDTPDVIGLKFNVYMDEGNGSGYRDITQGTIYYYQNNE
jgi:hypothetical protein